MSDPAHPFGRELVPPAARYVEAAIPVSLAIAVSVQRDALVPLRWPALVAGLAALPWIVGLVVDLDHPFRRLVCAVLVLGAVAGLVVDPVEIDMVPFFLVFLVAHDALVAPRWESSLVFGASIALMVGVDLSNRYDGAFVWILGLLFSWAGGIAVRSQFQLASNLATAQSELADRAVEEERQRIAREIHDVVAHTLSVTMLYITGARLAIRRDPAEAEEALLAAERMGRESLVEIRRTVGLLAPGTSGTESPMPSAADVPDLVEEFRAAGLDVDLTLVGDVATLAPATGLALYRIAQESLTNVAKHAAGTRASLTIRAEADQVSLQVRNPVVDATRANGTGLGVRGMRQRAELLGGTFRAEPGDGGWTVETRIPRITTDA